MKKKKIEKYEPFTITEFTSDWYYPKTIEIEKGYCHNYFDFRKIYYAKCVGS